MNEVRDIVARMMEDPAPPPRSPGEVLRIARQVNRRRSMLAALGSGALVLLLVAGVGVAVRSWPHRAPTVVPSTVDIAGPVARTVPAHGEVMAQRIAAALPEGVVAGAVETFSHATDPVPAPAAAVQILAAAVVEVVQGDQRGEIFAYIVSDGGSGESGSCDPARGEAMDGCSYLTVDGVQLNVFVAEDPLRGHLVAVTRFLPGGRLVVGAWQAPVAVDLWQTESREPVWYVKPLAEPPSAAFLAGLAADPEMLPA